MSMRKTSLNYFKSSISYYVITSSNETFIFTCCKLSLVPKLTLISCSSLVTIQQAMVKSCIHSQTCVPSMIIFPIFKWKKVLSKCCLTILGGITKLIAKAHICSICCFGSCFAILIFGMWFDFKTSVMCDMLWFLLKIDPILWQTSHPLFHMISLLEIVSFATSHYATSMQLVVVCNYLGHIYNYKFSIV